MKIHLMGAELLHADGQTDMTKLIVDFHNFVKEPKDYYQLANLSILQFLTLGNIHTGVPGGMDITSGECSLC